MSIVFKKIHKNFFDGDNVTNYAYIAYYNVLKTIFYHFLKKRTDKNAKH